MNRYWLTPVQLQREEIVLLEDRIQLEPAETAAAFIQFLKAIHPRMLVSFKASLLLSEEAEAACGIDELPFEMNSAERIHFGPDDLEPSHCAQAYFDRLPSSKEMEIWLASADTRLVSNGGDAAVEQWVNLMKNWHKQGYSVTLLREDE